MMTTVPTAIKSPFMNVVSSLIKHEISLEVLYTFLFSFKRVMTYFESKKQNLEINYLFFVYNRMFNYIENVLFSLHTLEVLGTLECTPIFMAALEKMKEKL